MSFLIIHLILHFVAPVVVARIVFPSQWKRTSFILVLTMMVDLDHLLANTIFDPLRCSIGFHPLHSYLAIIAYVLMLALPQLRLVAIGLLIHMGLDGLECIRLTW